MNLKTQIALVILIVAAGIGLSFVPSHHVYAQQGGVASVVGGVSGVNQFPPTSATGQAGSVTNPASNFVVNVLGGPIYFGGTEQLMGHSTLTLPASSTNLIVWNAFTEQLYSKQAVTGPGSQGTNAINGPGIPTTLLFADPTRGELALATVVCNATACGNGGNGSITDNRSVNNFPAGLSLPGVAFANLPAVPDGTMLMCTSCTQPGAGSVSPCTSGAANVLAMRSAGAWRCY